MVGSAAGSRARTGFTLVEVVVAVVVLAVGVLGAVAAGTMAARLLREAEAAEAAVAVAGGTADSLLQRADAGTGEATADGYRVRWSVASGAEPALVTITVAYHDGTRPRRLTVHALHAPPLRPVGSAE